uniref:Uncharacterized protein n=1 Tax=Daucus carota subsp. sativus TaxID=79200 RepID=A0A166F9S8_DAUCS
MGDNDICKSSIFFSDQLLCHADILPPSQEPSREVVDCSTCGSSGYAITGDLDLLENLLMKTDARYIFVVEKHAIFQRLTEDRVFNQIPCIFITAKGYPDIATRNPAGLAILCTFKYGSTGMGLEAYRYACNVKWLGLRKDDLELIPEQSYIPLKPRDLQIAKSLISSDILQKMTPVTYHPTHDRTLPPPDQVISSEAKNILLRHFYARSEEKLRSKRGASETESLTPEQVRKHPRSSTSDARL